MVKRNYKAEEIVSKLRQADVLIAQGTGIPDFVRTLGVTQAMYYRWRREFSGLQTDQVKRMKDLELENQRLRKGSAYHDHVMTRPFRRQPDQTAGGLRRVLRNRLLFQGFPPYEKA